jgi:predicted O-methyltransferase YrrM
MPGPSDFLAQTFHFLRHQLQAKGIHSLHSPFMFEFYDQVVLHPYLFSAYEMLEAERNILLGDDSGIFVEEAGAGNKGGMRKVSSIAGRSLMPFSKASFLLRICHWMKPERILETGTCLGLTTCYLAWSGAEVFTFEASETMGQRAAGLWGKLGLNRINLISGRLEETLPAFLSREMLPIQLAVVDANHRYEATMLQYKMLKKAMNGTSCIVFDDIYWSSEMTRAWNEIKEDKDAIFTIDLFHLGLVFFHPGSVKQHFVLRW